MPYLIIMLSIIGIFIGRKFDKSIVNPVIMFNCWWLQIILLLIFSELMKISIYEPTKTAYQIVLVSLIAFNIIAFIKVLLFHNKVLVFSSGASNNVRYDSRESVVFILSLMVLMYSIIKYRDSILNLLHGSMSLGQIRTDYFDSIRGGLEAYIISPVRYAVLVITITDVVQKKINVSLIAMNIINVTLFALASGGRFVVVNLLYMCVCAYAVYRKSNQVSYRQKLIVRLLCCVLLTALIIMTSSRSAMMKAAGYTSITERVLGSAITYFAGGVIYIGILNKRFNISSVSKGYNFIRGFAQPLIDMLAIFGIKALPESFSVINDYTNYETNIGRGISFNAFFTGPGYFYLDGGLFGTWIETALFSLVLILVYDFVKQSKGKNAYVTAIYILLFAVLCDFTTRWMLADPAYAYALIIIRLCYKKRPANVSDILQESKLRFAVI